MKKLIQKGKSLIDVHNTHAPIKVYGHPFITKVNNQGDLVGAKPLEEMPSEFSKNQIETIKFINELNNLGDSVKAEIMLALTKYARKLKYLV